MKLLASLLVLTLALSGCSAYKTTYIPFKPPEGYPNHNLVSGVSVGGEAYPDRHAAKRLFGFDIRGAGLLPVQLVLDNKSGHTVQIESSQSFLIDDDGNYWQVLSNNVAFDRLEQSTQLASYFSRGAGKGALVGAAAGGILATALGIVSGSNVAEYLAKGAAMGGGAGAVLGGSAEGGSEARKFRMSEDLREKGLEGKEIPDLYLANGFLFFPGEAKSAKELRLQWRERDGSQVRRAVLPL